MKITVQKAGFDFPSVWVGKIEFVLIVEARKKKAWGPPDRRTWVLSEHRVPDRWHGGVECHIQSHKENLPVNQSRYQL